MVSNVRAKIGVGVLLGLSLSALMATAPAQAVDECQDEIAALRSETENAAFLGKNADKAEEGLLLKLDNAAAKLGEGKYLDAIQKLRDFQSTVTALDAGDKIDPDDASVLLAGAEKAIDCVERLRAQAPTAA
jgi:hypothetical protein